MTTAGNVRIVRVNGDGLVTNRSLMPAELAGAVCQQDPSRHILPPHLEDELRQARFARYDPVTQTLEAIDRQPMSLDVARKRAFGVIDQKAEQLRAAWWAPGSGQAAEYEAVAAEAASWRSKRGAPSESEFPMLAATRRAAASAGRTVTLADVVAEVEAARAKALSGLAQIREIRLSAKERIATATAPGEIDDIVQGLSWPVP